MIVVAKRGCIPWKTGTTSHSLCAWPSVHVHYAHDRTTTPYRPCFRGRPPFCRPHKLHFGTLSIPWLKTVYRQTRHHHFVVGLTCDRYGTNFGWHFSWYKQIHSWMNRALVAQNPSEQVTVYSTDRKTSSKVMVCSAIEWKWNEIKPASCLVDGQNLECQRRSSRTVISLGQLPSR